MDIEAIVTGLDRDHALIKVSENPGGCGRCGEPGGCSTGVLTQIFRKQSCQIFRVPNDIGAREGDKVMVSVADGVTLQTALAVYFVPVLLVILGAWIGTALAPENAGDARALIGAGLGLVVSLVFLGWYKQRQAGLGHSQPVLTRKLPETVHFQR